MTRSIATLLVLLFSFAAIGTVSAEDGEATAAYVQAMAFNVPLLEGWENQSTEQVAQFHLGSSQATIRMAIVPLADPLAAVEKELLETFDLQPGAPIYQDKVNLADGTWTVRAYQPDADTSVSVMARRIESKTVVISFVESNPAVSVFLATIAQAGDTRDDPTTEIGIALEAFAATTIDELGEPSTLSLPSGSWRVFANKDFTAMGMVFGNDSYVAVSVGPSDSLSLLADAYYTTLLGFFITPDNSRYLALAMAAVFGILGLLIFSFYWRARNIDKDLAMIESLERDD